MDLYQSETLELFRKNYTLKDPRFMIVAGTSRFLLLLPRISYPSYTLTGDLLNLKAKGITAQYIANATNTTFTGGGSGINKALHDVNLSPFLRQNTPPPLFFFENNSNMNNTKARYLFRAGSA